jgi:hypothetical protein
MWLRQLINCKQLINYEAQPVETRIKRVRTEK